MGGVPLLALGLYLVIVLLSPVWMNQFGWDRTTVRAQMLLPIEVRQILLGKFLGLLRFTLLAAGIICAGLLTFYHPSLREILAGIPTAGIAFMASWTIGLLASLQAPRAHPPGGLAFPPHYLAWIPAVLMIVLGVALSKVWGLGGQEWPYLAPCLLWLLMAGSLGVGYLVLPYLEKWFLANREKLLSM
jgi:hypothetical protein